MSLNHHSGARRDARHLAWFVLGMTAVGLIGAITSSVASIGQDSGNGVAVPNPPSPTPVAALAGGKRDDSPDYAEKVLARPLFSSSRRPPAALATPVIGLSKPLPRLTGVVVSPVGKFALFANADGGRPLVMSEGDHLGATVIEAIMAGEVTVRGPDGVIVLRSSFDESVNKVSLPAPARAPGSGPRRLPFPMRTSPQAVRANQGFVRPASLGGAATPQSMTP